MRKDFEKILHLYRRAGFGLKIQDFRRMKKISLKEAINELFANSASYKKLIAVQGQTPTIEQWKKLNPLQKRELRKKLRKLSIKINNLWFLELTTSKAVLREKMALFWSNHFACSPTKGVYHAQKRLNTIRQLALGNFKDLVIAISKDPAMIHYLNNQQNRKGSPNENFARELMELFTLGRGNYSENDIKESARAFTGWKANGDDFKFIEKHHDYGEKTFFGKTGLWNGEDIIQMILEKKQTAIYICTKIYKYFVNPVPDKEIIHSLADSFHKNYDIKNLMEKIFSSHWFYDKKNIGVKIKSPIELLGGFVTQFGLRFNNEKSLSIIQRGLGQQPLNPPNVAGWKGDKAWIDSSSLLFRLKLPEMFFKSSELYLEAKAEDDAKKMTIVKKRFKNFQVVFYWKGIHEYFSQFNDDKDLIREMFAFLLSNFPKVAYEVVLSLVEENTNTKKIEELSLILTSLPEYQTC